MLSASGIHSPTSRMGFQLLSFSLAPHVSLLFSPPPGAPDSFLGTSAMISQVLLCQADTHVSEGTAESFSHNQCLSIALE